MGIPRQDRTLEPDAAVTGPSTTLGVASPESTQPRTHVRWLLVFCMFGVSTIANIDRVNVSLAGQFIANEFHLSHIQLGWVFSAFVFGYALFQVPGGRFADWLGPRYALTLGVIWWCLFTVLITPLQFGAAGLIPLLIGIRFSLGAGEAVVYPASNCVVAAWIPSSERGLANGLIFSGVGFGAAATPLLLTSILLHSGWRMTFWASSVMGLLAGAAWFVIARDSPRDHPWVSPAERTFIESGLNPATPCSIDARLPWSAIVGDRRLRAITLSYFCYGYTSYIFYTWFFIYLRAVRGLSMRESSYYTMIPFLAVTVGSLSGGWMNDGITRRYGRRAGRCGLAAVAMGLCAVLVTLGSQEPNAHLAIVILAAGVGCLYVSQSSFWSVSADIGGRSAGSVSGVMNMGCQLGGALTASLTPLIASRFGWRSSFLVASAICGVGAMAWLLVKPGPIPPRVS